MTRVLLVEDDNRLATLVQDYLQSHGFEVTLLARGDHVEQVAKALQPDILLLDLMLPGKDGLTVCRDIRPHFSGPILMLTARDSDLDQVLGLEFGADDYVIKPVEPRVLLARINALLRRTQKTTAPELDELCYGALLIKPSARRVTLSGHPVALSTQEFELLLALASNAGEIQSRESLFDNLYRRPYDGLDRSIDVRVSHLRKKLGDSADAPERIKTIWGRGYLFVPEAW
jgi:DNA-binding response OmpR family regulator